jgi:hypothetical protein
VTSLSLYVGAGICLLVGTLAGWLFGYDSGWRHGVNVGRNLASRANRPAFHQTYIVDLNTFRAIKEREFLSSGGRVSEEEG